MSKDIGLVDKANEIADPAHTIAEGSKIAVSAIPPAKTGETQAPAIARQECKPEEPFISVGKKVHNEVTYRGVDWILNSAVAVSFAYCTARTKLGQKWFTQPVTGFFKKCLSPFIKTESTLNEGAVWGTRFVSIMAGGTAIIPPLMVMENKSNKSKIIRWIDEKWYGKDAVANDPKFQESYEAIKKEPHKSFAIGMAARLTVLAPLIGMTICQATHKPLLKYVYDPIGKGSKWIAGKVGIKPGAHMADPLKGSLEQAENGMMEMQSNWDFLHRTIGFDLGLTFLYSFMHEYAYKGLAALGMKETDTDRLPGQQFTPSGQKIMTPSSVATEVDAIEHSSPIMEPAHKEKFTSKIKPKEKFETPVPNELYIQKLASRESGEDTGMAHRSPA